ncbi:hypothetical protein HanXRQr2_Chr17g0803791 [Helianthus annuus]|uniref:Uncharacterized protein n=1 Tax=Helianthus annuus TaxID=4232 RepID=A0A9K3DH77_HELAN|nr:hypothetical protein HanXRQr2_Chr17g0803791 [Helianthus annuus]KAJ0429238.1 hypothetical protein HanHA300_Chr17g0655051 [Helianthus annuus]KAJ0813260.1 hypothetical protein HanPSC8_Chr17g0771391 [Helianthus annuus]
MKASKPAATFEPDHMLILPSTLSSNHFLVRYHHHRSLNLQENQTYSVKRRRKLAGTLFE